MKAGVAQLEITPPPGGELSGFALRVQPATGVLDPLYVRALHLREGAERLLWLHCDLIGLNENTVARFRRWARQTLGLGGPQVLLTATHTHSGPATIALRDAGAMDARYLDYLDEQLQAAAGMAMREDTACTLVTGETECPLAIHRRGAATAHTDPRVAVLGFQRADGTFLAVVVNHAIHPVALGHVNRMVSADLPGAAAREIGRRLPGGPVVIMSNGACGNLNPPQINVAWEQMQEWGEQLGGRAVAALATATAGGDGLFVTRRVVSLPLDWLDAAGIDAYIRRILATVPDDGFGQRVRSSVHAWGEELLAALARGQAPHTREAELHVVQLGGVVLVGINAEIFSVFTDWLRRDTGLGKIYTVGYANGDMGYLCTREAYPEGGYEVDWAHIFYGGYRFQSGALEALAVEAGMLIRQLPGARPPPTPARTAG